MTWTLIYTRGMTKIKKEKEIDTSLPRRRLCWHIGVRDQSWRIFLFQGWNLKIN